MRALRISLIALFIGLTALPCGAESLLDLSVKIRQLLDDKADPKVRYSDLTLRNFINQAQRDVISKTACLTNTTSQSLSVATTFYQLPSDLIWIQQVTFVDTAGRTRELEEVAERSFIQANPDWERQSGAPMQYFVRDSTGSSSSTDVNLQMAITPVPSTTSATGTMYIRYSNQATDLTAATAIPFDGLRYLYPYHEALVYYVVGQIKLIEKDPATAAVYMGMYEASLKSMKEQLGSMPNYAPGFSGGTK